MHRIEIGNLRKFRAVFSLCTNDFLMFKAEQPEKPDILQFVELSLLDQLICDVAFPDDAFNFGIDGEEICAYDEVNFY
jgi:hypothetical protein